MHWLPFSIAWFLRFATDKENLTILLNLRCLSFIANRSLFFITQYWFMLWRRWIGGCDCNTLEGILHPVALKIFEPPHDKTNKMAVRPAKTQNSLGIRSVWSESSLFAQWVAKEPSFLHADSEDSDQTGWICVFAGRTNHFVGFVMRLLNYDKYLWNPLDFEQESPK